MSYTIQANQSERAIVVDQTPAASQELADQPSARELFSYGVCCVAQGLVWAASFAFIVFAAGAANQGILSTLP